MHHESSCRAAGATLVCDSVICNPDPDAGGQTKCRELGAALVK